MNRHDRFMWAVGILEGEGCFTWSSRGKKQKARIKRFPRIQLQMTDRDVVKKVADVFGRGAFNGPYRRGGYRLNWIWAVVWNDAEKVMRQILPHMGKRRSKRIRELLRFYK